MFSAFAHSRRPFLFTFRAIACRVEHIEVKWTTKPQSLEVFLTVSVPLGGPLPFTWRRCYDLRLTWNNQACPFLFILCLCLFLSLCPYQPYFISWILSTTLRFLTLFFRSYLCLLVLSTTFLFMKVSFRSDIILCGWLGLKHQLTN